MAFTMCTAARLQVAWILGYGGLTHHSPPKVLPKRFLSKGFPQRFSQKVFPNGLTKRFSMMHQPTGHPIPLQVTSTTRTCRGMMNSAAMSCGSMATSSRRAQIPTACRICTRCAVEALGGCRCPCPCLCPCPRPSLKVDRALNLKLNLR